MTGEEIWSCGGLGSNPSPLVADKDTLYAMSGHQRPALITISAQSHR